MSRRPADVRARALQIDELRRMNPKITQREIAARLNMTRSNVAQYVRGAIKASHNFVGR